MNFQKVNQLCEVCDIFGGGANTGTVPKMIFRNLSQETRRVYEYFGNPIIDLAPHTDTEAIVLDKTYVCESSFRISYDDKDGIIKIIIPYTGVDGGSGGASGGSGV